MNEDRHQHFALAHPGFRSVFRPGRLSVGLVVPIEAYPSSPVPDMTRHLERARRAERLGFTAVWIRDVPFNVPSFGDAGQTFDPFVYLGLLAGQTERVALGVASVILPLRHPAHVAKAAASVDVLSGGRMLLGVASGDRPEEYPALNISFRERGARFRESFEYMQRLFGTDVTDAPSPNRFGTPGRGLEMLPTPRSGSVPMLITGGSQQDPEWIARHGNGWMIYPRSAPQQAQIIGTWRARIERFGVADKPVMQPLYVDLLEDDDAPPRPIHLGLRTGARHLITYLESLEAIGINHVALNLRFNRADIDTTLERLSRELLPRFHG